MVKELTYTKDEIYSMMQSICDEYKIRLRIVDSKKEVEELVVHPERIPELKRQSVEYVRRHHDYRKVAEQYEAFYASLLE